MNDTAAETTTETAPVETPVKIGIKETKEMLVFLFMLGKVVKESKENDGKIDYMDAMLLMKILPSMGPAIEDAGKIVEEIKDIDGDEANELIAYLGTEVGLVVGKEQLVIQIVAGLEVAKSLNNFIKVL